jgi:hypothetical protein|tara:strand:+ start:1210 stop:2574 length:1365 start_codon:yes stop_codon:yes gene_type:complete
MDLCIWWRKCRINLAFVTVSVVLASILVGISAEAVLAQQAYKESVRGRQRLDFESYGLSLDLLSRPDDRSDAGRLAGSFDLFSKATVDAGRDSNVTRVKNGAISSAVTEAKAEAALRSNWTNHEALLIVDLTDRRVAESSRENTTDARLATAVRIDVDDGVFARGFAEAKRGHIRRGDDADPGAGFEPLTFNQYLVGGVYDDRRDDRVFTRIVGEAVHRSYNPTDNVDRDTLDRTTFNLRGFVGYSPGGEYDLFVSPSLLRDVYTEEASEDQNSTRLTLSVGASRDITGVSAFNGRVGVSHRMFDASTRSAQTDFVLSGGLLWNLTPIMTFTADADIENQQSDDPSAGTKLSRSFRVGLDYDPFEQLIIGGYFSVANEEFQQIDREDDDMLVGANATYLINEHLFAGLSVEREVSDSTDPARAFDATTVMFRISAKLCCQADDGTVNPFNLGRF